MKFKKFTVLALMACLAFTACGKENEVTNEEPVIQEAPGEAQDPDVQEPGTSTPDAGTEVTYSYITEGTVGDYTYEIEPNFADDKKYYLDDLKNRCWFLDSLEEPNAPLWVIISSGEKSSGGYDIGVVDITEEDGTIVITVGETSPSPDESTTEEITTPNVTVRFEYGENGTPSDIKVVNTAGVEIPSAY